ncbi:MFS transporter [Corynebacterium variabile]
MCSSALPPRLIARWGPVPVSVVGTVVLAVAVAAVAWSPSGTFLALALFVVGVVEAVVDVGQNVAGVRAQDAAGRSVLSSMHAMWSLGGVAAGALATASAAAGVDMRLHLAVTAVPGIAVAVVGGRWIGEQAPAPAEDASPGGPPVPGRWRSVAVLALPLVAVALCGTVVEDVANNWAAVSGVQLAGLDLGVAGVAFTVAIGSQCIGRFTGDPLINRYGTVRVARVGGVLIAAGGVLIATAVGPLPLFLGFALAGYGTATLVPSALGGGRQAPRDRSGRWSDRRQLAHAHRIPGHQSRRRCTRRRGRTALGAGDPRGVRRHRGGGVRVPRTAQWAAQAVKCGPCESAAPGPSTPSPTVTSTSSPALRGCSTRSPCW